MQDHLTDEIRQFLQEPRFAVIATIGQESLPQLTVMWYDLEGDTVLMNTKESRVKDENLERDPRAALCIEDGYRYVTLTGTVELNNDQEQARADLMRLARRYDGDKVDQYADDYSKNERVSIRLKIENVVAYGFDK